MTRLKSKPLNFIPVSVNFSDLKQGGKEIENIEEDFSRKFENDREYELFICNMLYNLNSEEKIAFLFLVLRNDGYKFNNIMISSILGIKTRPYIKLMKEVKRKLAKYLVKTNQLV